MTALDQCFCFVRPCHTRARFDKHTDTTHLFKHGRVECVLGLEVLESRIQLFDGGHFFLHDVRQQCGAMLPRGLGQTRHYLVNQLANLFVATFFHAGLWHTAETAEEQNVEALTRQHHNTNI
jgi:hypothetical protein